MLSTNKNRVVRLWCLSILSQECLGNGGVFVYRTSMMYYLSNNKGVLSSSISIIGMSFQKTGIDSKKETLKRQLFLLHTRRSVNI
ncbi:hypothetical protein BDF14DRAFT_1842549 [Spinellus fusiger]|nr:hypothetical protein BDF14DRAFT_1842549 [Spinellus fusiger]